MITITGLGAILVTVAGARFVAESYVGYVKNCNRKKIITKIKGVDKDWSTPGKIPSDDESSAVWRVFTTDGSFRVYPPILDRLTPGNQQFMETFDIAKHNIGHEVELTYERSGLFNLRNVVAINPLA